MRVNIKNVKKCKAKILLKCGGYRFRKDANDFVKEDATGRFHATSIDNKEFELHYDLYLKDGTHFAPPVYYKIYGEVKRLFRVTPYLNI